MRAEEEKPEVKYTTSETIAMLEEKVSSLEKQLLEAQAEAIRAYKLATSHLQAESDIIQRAEPGRAAHIQTKQAYSDPHLEEKT